MQVIGWVMIALFVWLFHGPWLAFKRAVDAEDWPSAGASLNRIRQIIAVNLPLGLHRRHHRRQWALLDPNSVRMEACHGKKARVVRL